MLFRSSFIKVSTTKEKVERLEAPVDARGIETAELKASAVRVAAEHVIEIENLNDINDKIVDAPEDVIYSRDNNDVEKGFVAKNIPRFGDRPDELGGDEHFLEEKVEGSVSNPEGEEKYAFTHDEIYEALVLRGSVEGQLDRSKDEIVKELKQGIFIHDSPDKVLNFLLEECAVGVWRRHILDPLEEEKGTRLAFWRHYLGDKVVEYVFTLEITHGLYNQAHTITLTSVRDNC